MKKLLIIALLATFSVGAQGAERKIAKPVNLEKVGEAIRDGKLYIGKKYGLPEKMRFHNIHDVALNLPCNGCHDLEPYPDNALFLRRAEFPYVVDEEEIGPVNRVKCLACHSARGIARTFYNVSDKPAKKRKKR